MFAKQNYFLKAHCTRWHEAVLLGQGFLSLTGGRSVESFGHFHHVHYYCLNPIPFPLNLGGREGGRREEER